MGFNILKKLLSIMLLLTMIVNLNCSAFLADSKMYQKQINSHFTSAESSEQVKEEQSGSTSLTLGKVTTICSVTFSILGFIVGCVLPSCSCCPCA